MDPYCVMVSFRGGDGDVATVECGDDPSQVRSSALSEQEFLLESDSRDISLGRLVKSSAPRRRRMLGGGLSVKIGRGGPRRNSPTLREAESYILKPSSSTRRRFLVILLEASTIGASRRKKAYLASSCKNLLPEVTRCGHFPKGLGRR